VTTSLLRGRFTTSFEFLASVVHPLLAEHRPDFFGLTLRSPISAARQAHNATGRLPSQWVNPLLHEHHCGAVVVHHTNKPPKGREKPDWQAGDFAYLAPVPRNGRIGRALCWSCALSARTTCLNYAPQNACRLGWHDVDAE